MTSGSGFTIAKHALRGGAIVARSLAAGAAFLAAGSLATAPAFAQDVKAQSISYKGVDLNTDCKTWRSGEANIGDEGQCIVYKTKIMNAQVANEQDVKSCLVRIKSALANGLTTREKLGTVTRENACGIAATLG